MVAGKGRRANLRADAKRHLQRAAALQRSTLFVVGFRARETRPVYQLTVEDVKQARLVLHQARQELEHADDKLSELALRIDRGWL